MEKTYFSKITKRADAINNECSCLYDLASALELTGNNKLSNKLFYIACEISEAAIEMTDILSSKVNDDLNDTMSQTGKILSTLINSGN